MKDELPIPEQVIETKRAMELARIWLVERKQVFVITPNLWDDPAAWGLLLVDLAKHVARAYEVQGRDAREILERIRAAFDAEWQHLTD